MARGSPLKWLNVLGCALAALVFAGSGCSHTSAPSRANGSAPTPLATATRPQPSPAGPSCGVTITGRHWYRAAPPARNAVLLLGAGPRGIVFGAQANGGICQVLPIAQQFARRGYHVAVFDWNIGNIHYGADMTRATHALLADGARRVVLGGFSRGALVGWGAPPNPGRGFVGGSRSAGDRRRAKDSPRSGPWPPSGGRYCWSAAKTIQCSHQEPARRSRQHTTGPTPCLWCPVANTRSSFSTGRTRTASTRPSTHSSPGCCELNARPTVPITSGNAATRGR